MGDLGFRFLMTALTLSVAAWTGPARAAAQDAFTWENATELSFVSTGGNASASTLGLKATLAGSGGSNAVKLEVGGVRGETDFVTRTATGTVGSFTVNKTATSRLTAENYFARGQYDRQLGEIAAFAGTGWDRNTFAGIRNRYAVVVGLGRTWIDGGSGSLKTDLGATYTIQKDVDPVPGADDGFGGIRLKVDATRSLTETASYNSTLVLDENLEETRDLRADWINSISVSISESLALKTSLQLLYDRLPSQIGVPLFDTGGNSTGSTVLTPGDELDSILTLTLVITL